jgi:hypothetical protein
MSRYILVETLISIAINAAISAGFAFLVFGGRTEIGLWGPHGLALDFAPQTFMIALMAVLVPTALTRRRVRTGALPGRRAPPPRLPRSLLVRALLVASLATVLLGGAATAVLAATWSGALDFATVLPLKIIYGALVALLVTPPALRAALTDKVAKEPL